MTEKLKFVLGRVENIVGKGENPGYQHFLLCQDCFLKASHTGFLTLSKEQILDSSKLKEFEEDNFKFDENGRKLSKRVENIVGKG